MEEEEDTIPCESQSANVSIPQTNAEISTLK